MSAVTESRAETFAGYALLGTAWLLLLLIALGTRPLLPVDETRYLSVAWEMWQRQDFLVPYLNGEPYSHKPPLLFWLMHAGWWLTGVNEWWPRMVPALLSLLCLVLTARVALQLWPQSPAVARAVPWLLFSGVFWLGFFTLVQFDLLLAACTLLAVSALAPATAGAGPRWWVVGIAIGVGVLTKGPVILLHVLPLTLLAPWWARGVASWWRWYGGVLFAVILGAALALAWAVPAGIAGGEEYRNAIFWGQTTQRMVESFAHGQPWWWYLPFLPLLLLPWSAWPPLWRGVRGLSREPALRMCLAWLVSAVIALSLVSGKQMKYLLPMFPACALLGARALATLPDDRLHARLPGGVLILIGLVLALLPVFAVRGDAAAWLGRTHWGWGLLLCALGLLLLLARPQAPARAVASVGIATTAMIAILHVGILRVGAPAYDLKAVSRLIADLQRARHEIAQVGKYHGQYHFLGRLQAPITALSSERFLEWSEGHASAYVIVYYDDAPTVTPAAALFAQAYRGGGLVVWPASILNTHPEWLQRLPNVALPAATNTAGSI